MNGPALRNRLGALALALSDRQAAAVARGTGLSPSRAAALVSIGNDPGLGVGGLARVLGLTQSVATRLVDDLARAGLVAKAPGRTGREVALTLSPDGATRRDRVLGLREEAARAALAALPAGDAPLVALIGALLAALTTDRAGADRMCRLCDEEACGLDDCPVERAARALG